MTAERLPTFCGSDAWLLCAIVIGSGRHGASLRDILAAGDYINHAILSGPQIRRGLAKLTHAGFVREAAGRFLVSGKAKSFWKRLPQKRKPVLRYLYDWEKFLAVPPPPEPDPHREEAEWPYPAITEDMVKKAYEEYVAGF
ncbi:MAG: hypothetical protein JW748_05720 [Anaerolineales bacterium]|nr:hypothetical protein [Anaerolineales bacterium]